MNRVYGVIGISARMANWNADFSGFPRTISDGTIFGSDKALKYPIKKMWDVQGEKVVYIKSLKLSKSKNGGTSLVPNTLKERYEHLFGVEDLKKCKDASEVLENLFSAIDVKNFGATFAEEGSNISITGAVQIGQGFNKYDSTNVEEQQILSPFRDGSDKNKGKQSAEGEEDKEAKNSTLGTKIVSDEAHYFYPFAINPGVYKEFEELGVTNGYQEEDYDKFKSAAITATTSYATNSKVGCENEFALFIETTKDCYLPNLDQFVTFEKTEKKNYIKIGCGEFLNTMKDQIQSIEIYYNPMTTIVETDLEGAKMYNIITRKEV